MSERGETVGGGEGTYTRSPMETGTLGTRRPLNLDALSTEAVAIVAGAADGLAEMSQLLRAAYEAAIADAGSDPTHGTGAADMAYARELLGRLEVSERGLRAAADIVGGAAPTAEDGPPGLPGGPADPEPQMAILRAPAQERARLANELHDGPAQALTNLVFQTEIAERAVRHDTATGLVEIAGLRQMLDHELETLRAYINQLRPPLIESDGLDEALREAASRLAEHDGVPVEVRLEASSDVIDETARAVALRIAQEALRNVAKHADADRVWLHTRLEPAGEAASERAGTSPDERVRWVMEIGDDGRGFDPAGVGGSTARRHFGLRFMRERSELLGARLSIESRPNAGTVVRLTIDSEGKGKQAA